MELTTELSLLTQQLRMRQMTNEHHRRVTNQVGSQVWQPYESMDHICDTPKLEGPIDYRQPTEICVSHIMRPIHE